MGIGEEKTKKKAWNIPYMKTMETIERKIDNSFKKGRRDTLGEQQRTKG